MYEIPIISQGKTQWQHCDLKTEQTKSNSLNWFSLLNVQKFVQPGG